MKRRIPILLLTLVICALAAFPALAGPPDISIITFQETFPVQSCGTFDVFIVGDTTVNLHIYYDADGNPVRWMHHDSEVWTFYSTAKYPVGGIATQAHYNVWGGFVDGAKSMSVLVHSGEVLKIVVPGLGNVYMQTGHTKIHWTGSGPLIGYVVDFAAGQTPWFLLEYVPELCELLD